jgi:HSP20 family protein
MLTRWDPFRESLRLSDAMNQLFEDSFVRPRSRYGANGGERRLHLPIDAYATDEEIVVHALIPGVAPDNVNITIEDATLTIAGEIPAPAEDVDWVMRETTYGPFRRTLNLNVPVNAEAADASFENGRLVLHLPKAEQAKPKQIKVSAK